MNTLPRRSLLLVLALLTACAAAVGGGGSEGRFQPSADNPFGAYLAGRFALSQADTRTAADSLLTALRAEPDQVEVIQRAFIATLLDGRPEAARLARRLPDNPLAVMVLVGEDAAAGRWEQAERRVRALPRQGIANLLRPLLLAWTLAGRGQTDQALALLRPLAEAGQGRGLHALHAAMIADLGGRPREAERFVHLALGAEQPITLRLVQIAGGILVRQGREEEAERLLIALRASHDELLFALSPEQQRQLLLQSRAVSHPTEGMAEAYLAFAASLRRQEAPELPLALARLALQLRPGFAAAMLTAADALAEERRYEAALAVLEGISPQDPLAAAAALRRAAFLDRLERTAEAITLLTGLVGAYPQAPQPHARLGDILRLRSRWQEAAAAYAEAIRRLDGLQPRQWVLFYSRGIAYERAGLWPAAEADFRRALALHPDQPFVLNYLAYSWVERGENLQEARRMLERAVALRPQDGHIADSLGWALFKLGDIAGAIQWLERAVEMEPTNSVINDHLGDAYWAAGRHREALFQWRRALALGPEGDEGPKIEAKIRNALASPPFAENRR